MHTGFAMQCCSKKTGNVRLIRVGLCAANPVVLSCRRSATNELRQAKINRVNADRSNGQDL